MPALKKAGRLRGFEMTMIDIQLNIDWASFWVGVLAAMTIGTVGAVVINVLLGDIGE